MLAVNLNHNETFLAKYEISSINTNKGNNAKDNRLALIKKKIYYLFLETKFNASRKVFLVGLVLLRTV